MAKLPVAKWIELTAAAAMTADALGGRSPQGYERALKYLLNAFRDGDVRARRFHDEPDGLTGKPVVTESDYWADKGSVWDEGIGVVEVERASLVPWLSGARARDERGPGRQPQHDWDGFWIQIVLRANGPDGLDGVSIGRLTEDMATWFEHRGAAIPDDSTIRKKLNPLFSRLGRN